MCLPSVAFIPLSAVRRNLFYARWYSPLHAKSFFKATSGMKR